MENIHIELSGEVLFHIGFLPVTNTLLTTWVVMAILAIGSYKISKSISLVPGRVQVAVEQVIKMLYGLFSSVLGESTKRFFPFLASFFIFIIVSNWFGLLPGVGTIQLDHVPLFRAPTADLNTTLALSLIGMIMLQYWGMRALGAFSYLSKFITFKNPIDFFVGILELISELGKVISFAFRLFGNIFAGEVLLVIIGALIPFFAPLPFLGLELFVGFIQALVFSMLLAVFLSSATSTAHH